MENEEFEKLSARERLKVLESEGFLFHGSMVPDIDTFEPRQASTLDRQTGKMINDGDPAVFASPKAEIATFRSLINSTRSTIAHKSHSSSFDLNDDGNPVFGADISSIELANDPDTVGYVYVFKRDDFIQKNEYEWISSEDVKPVKVIAVKGTDLPDNIEILASSGK